MRTPERPAKSRQLVKKSTADMGATTGPRRMAKPKMEQNGARTIASDGIARIGRATRIKIGTGTEIAKGEAEAASVIAVIETKTEIVTGTGIEIETGGAAVVAAAGTRTGTGASARGVAAAAIAKGDERRDPAARALARARMMIASGGRAGGTQSRRASWGRQALPLQLSLLLLWAAQQRGRQGPSPCHSPWPCPARWHS